MASGARLCWIGCLLALGSVSGLEAHDQLRGSENEDISELRFNQYDNYVHSEQGLLVDVDRESEAFRGHMASLPSNIFEAPSSWEAWGGGGMVDAGDVEPEAPLPLEVAFESNIKYGHDVNKIMGDLKRQLEVQQGSNCMTVGGGYSPPYSLCEGCMIQEAIDCVDDMRHNRSMNVPKGCDLQGLMVEPQPNCCTVFFSKDDGVNIDPQTSAYNDALRCLEMVNCKCVEPEAEDCSATDGTMLDIYKNLEEECYSHTVHSNCRTSCGAWIHDGELPLPNDCKSVDDGGCWEFFPAPKPPLYDESAPGCGNSADLNSPYKRYKWKVVGDSVMAQYDWWQCWYNKHCYTPDGVGVYYPPVRDGVKIYNEGCNAEEQVIHDDAIASGASPPFDCVPGGIPGYCNTDLAPDNTGTMVPVGISVPAKSGFIKREPIDCKVDAFACKPTTSSGVTWGTGKNAMSIFLAVAAGVMGWM
jgi:hypothetical protein